MVRKLKLRESAYILRESEDVYQVVFTGTRVIKRFGVDALTREVINSFKKEDNPENIIDSLSGKYSLDEIGLCIDSLEKFGIIRSYDDSFSVNPRYIRQLSFIGELTSSWGEALQLQNKIENSKISVFGVGGIGTWIVNGLYQIGVGEIRISDPDIISESNLNRQLFFSQQDVGKYKVDVLSEKLPDANIRTYRKIVSPDSDLEEIITGSNFLVNCADTPSVADTSRILSKYASKHQIPYSVSGGYNLHLGMIGPIIVPGKTACFDCFIEYQKENDPLSNLEKIKDIEQTGNVGPIAGAVANIQVMDIFKYLTGKGRVNFNRFAEIDFMDLSISWKEFNKREGCRCC